MPLPEGRILDDVFIPLHVVRQGKRVVFGWEEYWAIAVRRRWWILLPLFFVWLAIWGASWFLPATYQSESLILVEQQKVPDHSRSKRDDGPSATIAKFDGADS